MQTIVECMQDPNAPWPTRIKACELILERAWGKPDQRALRNEEGISSLTIKFVAPDVHTMKRGKPDATWR